MRFGKDVTELRNLNRAVVLTNIYKYGPISKSKLAEIGSLSRVTITNILDKLLEQGLIIFQSKGKSTGGRQPGLFKLNYDAFFALGIDIGESEINGILINLKGEILQKETVEYKIDNKKDAINLVVDKSTKIINSLLKFRNLLIEKVYGIGISFPGTVDPITGIIYDSPNVDGVGLSLKEILKKKININVPIFIENDANAAALGEYWFGSGMNKKFILYIFAGEGTGCGLVIDGKIYRGFNHAAADVGHTVIDLNGRKCRCGNFGCVETYSSYESIAQRFEEKIKQGETSSISINGDSQTDVIKVERIIEEAKKGDQLASKIIEETGRILGIACVNLINLYDPDIVIIGGKLSKAKKLITDPLEKLIRDRTKVIQRDRLLITQAKLEPNACAIGAAALVIEDLFKEK